MMQPHDSVDRWFDALLREIQRSQRTLQEALAESLRALAEYAQLQQASLSLTDVGTLSVLRTAGSLRLNWIKEYGAAPRHPATAARASVDDAVSATDWQALRRALGEARQGELAAAPAASPARGTTFVMLYAERPIGELRIERGHALVRCEHPHAFYERFARRCALLAQRYQVRGWSEQHLGKQFLLVGASAVLQQLELDIECTTTSDLPVLLSGEFGTETSQLAAALHCCGPQRSGPFVEINCSDPTGSPARWFEQARGGTLFFNGVEELPLAVQHQLPQCLASRHGQWLSRRDGSVRIVASTHASLPQRVREGSFSRALLAELDFLAITVPPLRERLDDLELLCTGVLQRHGHAAHTKCTAVLYDACRGYAWPENLFELERVLTRLAVMSAAGPIREDHIRRYTPWLLGSEPRIVSSLPAALGVQHLRAAPEAPCDPDLGELDAAVPPAGWVRCAIDRDLAELDKLHDGLRRALLYLGEHFAQPISLGHLAREARVSPSHLTFLFRSTLSTAFKPFLCAIRIHKAKELLLASQGRVRITAVAFSVGFTDMSHFEKSFRRLVGQSAREFRRQKTAADVG